MRLIRKAAAILTVAALLSGLCVPASAAEKKAEAAVSGSFTGSNTLSKFLYGRFDGNPASISVPTSKIGKASAGAMFQKLGDAAEEAFIQNGTIDHVLSFNYSYDGGSSVKLTLQYADKGAVSRRRKAKALSAKADEILRASVTPEMTDAQKAAALYQYLSSNVSYDRAALNDFIEKDTGANYYAKQTAYSALCDGKAICQGFAKAYKLLCDKADVPCIVVFGTTQRAGGGDVAHAWNRVYLDGAWWTVDATNPQLNICAQDGIFISAATAKKALVPNKQWMLDKELGKYTLG